MTKLDCTATQCVYNKEKVCSKDNVLVGCENAHDVDATCCESFKCCH